MIHLSTDLFLSMKVFLSKISHFVLDVFLLNIVKLNLALEFLQTFVVITTWWFFISWLDFKSILSTSVDRVKFMTINDDISCQCHGDITVTLKLGHWSELDVIRLKYPFLDQNWSYHRPLARYLTLPSLFCYWTAAFASPHDLEKNKKLESSNVATFCLLAALDQKLGELRFFMLASRPLVL